MRQQRGHRDFGCMYRDRRYSRGGRRTTDDAIWPTAQSRRQLTRAPPRLPQANARQGRGVRQPDHRFGQGLGRNRRLRQHHQLDGAGGVAIGGIGNDDRYPESSRRRRLAAESAVSRQRQARRQWTGHGVAGDDHRRQRDWSNRSRGCGIWRRSHHISWQGRHIERRITRIFSRHWSTRHRRRCRWRRGWQRDLIRRSAAANGDHRTIRLANSARRQTSGGQCQFFGGFFGGAAGFVRPDERHAAQLVTQGRVRRRALGGFIGRNQGIVEPPQFPARQRQVVPRIGCQGGIVSGRRELKLFSRTCRILRQQQRAEVESRGMEAGVVTQQLLDGGFGLGRWQRAGGREFLPGIGSKAGTGQQRQ